MVRILFLNGLTANECYSLLGQYGLTEPEEMATYIQCHVKVEEEDFGEVRVKREDLKNPAAASSSIPDSAMAALTNPDLLYPIMADDEFMGEPSGLEVHEHELALRCAASEEGPFGVERWS